MTSAGNEHGGASWALWVPLCPIVRGRLSEDSGSEDSFRHCIRDSQRCPPHSVILDLKASSARSFSAWVFIFHALFFFFFLHRCISLSIPSVVWLETVFKLVDICDEWLVHDFLEKAFGATLYCNCLSENLSVASLSSSPSSALPVSYTHLTLPTRRTV